MLQELFPTIRSASGPVGSQPGTAQISALLLQIQRRSQLAESAPTNIDSIAVNIAIMSRGIARKLSFTAAIFDVTKSVSAGTDLALNRADAVRAGTERISLKRFLCAQAPEQNSPLQRVCWINPTSCRLTVRRKAKPFETVSALILAQII